MTDAEITLRNRVRRDGVHVVHVWAPWCDNSIHELAPVWAGAADRHPEVSFTHVSIWADGDDGASVLREHGVEGGAVLVVPGPKPEKPDRRTSLLGFPVSWIPTTWVLNRSGLMATAFNYGEVTSEQLAQAIAGAQSAW